MLKDLEFNYSQENILKNINIKIKKNTVIGLFGKSGSGKSTLVDLILGLRNPSKGKILIDNEKDINDLGQDWRNIIGYVPQNLYLLDDTLKKNIALGINLESIDELKILKAIKSSQLENFVKNNLDKGLETSVGERGVRLSGGQKQRIGIARALYKDPEILIFDEATSALDHDTEKKIIDTINTLKNKKTIIIISHRLSALNICDTIYELKDKTINIFKN